MTLDTAEGYYDPLLAEPAPRSSIKKWAGPVGILMLVCLATCGFILQSLQKGAVQLQQEDGFYGSSMLVQTSRGASSSTDELWERKPDVRWIADFPAKSLPVIDISSTATDQEIVGFGGAFTETAANVFYRLPEAVQERILDMYFSLEGLGYTMGRTHINSCDFTLGSYSFDDVKDDFDLVHFDTQLEHDVKSGLISFIQTAQKRIAATGRALKLLASPWSPPAWMKTNGQMDGPKKGPGYEKNAPTNTIYRRYYDVWGRYISKWVSAHESMGINIWGVTIQNEPLWNQEWESTFFSAESAADFLGSSLGPAMKESNPKTLIFVYDMFGSQLYDWAQTLYSHPTASKYVDGVAWHWYAGDLFSLVKKTHVKYPKSFLLASELTYEQIKWAPGTKVEDGDWSFGEGYGHDIMGNLNAGARGWLDWNLILDPTGGPNHVGNVCDSAVMANVTEQRLIIHPQYYYIGHFSKYILPGSKRILSKVTGSVGPVSLNRSIQRGYGVCTAEDGLQATAWKRPDQQIVVVVQNCADAAVDFKVKHMNRAIKATIPAHAIQTYMTKDVM